MNKKKVLILGGEGFLGRNIADLLSANFACFSLDRKKSIFNKRKDRFIKSDPYKEKIKSRYAVIIHLIDNKIEKEVLFKKAERKLIKNCNIRNGVHLILFSSAVIYANPDSEYGKRKLLLEKIYRDYCRKNSVKLTILRPFNIYGHYQLPGRPGSLVANIFCNYFAGKTTEINDLHSRRDFICAKDVAKFVEYSIKNKFYQVCDVATNKTTSLKKLLSLIKKIAPKKISIIDRKNPEKINCPAGKNVLIDKIKLVPLSQGLKETYAFYEQNCDNIKKSNL